VILAIDADETLFDNRGREYGDVTTPIRLMPGARHALRCLKKAGHVIVVVSARANLALRKDPQLDPLVRAGKRSGARWSLEVNEARYRQMVDYCAMELDGLVDAVDDGGCGKYSADLFIDDKGLRYGYGQLALGWMEIARIYGEPVAESEGED